ncbi:nucleotidyltransferase family protein [bacterium]|nr:nucleotidyltransferase family protein [bacterium]MCP5462607.1 nucleotidyltransferase family protein [bacterium]
MKAIIMAAGYATRLYPLTENKAKPLLPIAGKPIIEYIIDKLEVFDAIDAIYVVTNQKFHRQFEEWAHVYSYKKPIEIINDGTLSNDDRLGAIGDMNFVIKQKKIDDDLIVVAGDNIFDFSLEALKQFSKNKNLVICAYNVGDIKLASRYGIVSVNQNAQVTSFVEKPAQPPSTLAALGIYLFKRGAVSLIKRYIDEGNNQDAPGFFVQWVYKVEDVYAYVFNGQWFDIGDLESYNHADAIYRSL